MRTLGNFSYLLAVAFLIASLAVNAMPPRAAMAGSPQQCPPAGEAGWTKVEDSSFHSVDGAVTYCAKAGSLKGGGSGCTAYEVVGSLSEVQAVISTGGNCGLSHWGYKLGENTATPTTPADTATPTYTPEDPTATPTDTPEDPTATPTDFPGDPTATPTDLPGDPTPAPTDLPGDPTPTPSTTDLPGDPTVTPTNTPEDPHGTQTTTPSAESLTVSSFCGPDAKHVNWWKISNASADEVSVSWQIQPGGAPADNAQVPASGEYEFSTVKVTGNDNLDVYFDSQGQQFAGSAEAAQGCTHPGETPNPGATFVPAPSGEAQVLIPVTGANLNTGGGLRHIFFNLGIGFLGLGLVLNGLSRERKSSDL
jgi:hypothetical protein